MKISISRDAILNPLQMVNNVIERRQTLPILSNVLISVKENILSLTGTDLEVEIINTCPIKNTENGDTTLPGRKLLDICKALPEGSNIEIIVDQERATLKSGRSRFTLSTLAASEFPSIDALISPFEFNISQKTFKRLIDQTQFCMAQQDVRYYLNGLMLELSDDQIIAVATDGHRLALSFVDIDLKTPFGVILPTNISFEPTSAPIRMMPSSSRSRRLSSPTLGISLVISSAPNLVSRASTSYFSM